MKAKKIISRLYFWIVLSIPVSLAIFSAIIIVCDQPLYFCWTKSCLETFINTFNIPISLLGLAVVTTGALFTYYTIELNYEQNERQLEQHTQTNYNLFKSEFLSLLNESDHHYEIIDIPNIWLFNALYPNARDGNQKLNTEFEEFINYPEHYGVISVMNSLTDILNSSSGARYNAVSYQYLANLFSLLVNIITLDADLNIGFLGSAPFTGDYSKTTISIAKDIFFIVSTVNAFEGWRFFDNQQRRIWRKNIDRLEVIREEAELLNAHVTNANNGGWGAALMRGDIGTFRKADILAGLPPSLSNNEAAKRYIFEIYTNEPCKNFLTSEAIRALADALHIKN